MGSRETRARCRDTWKSVTRNMPFKENRVRSIDPLLPLKYLNEAYLFVVPTSGSKNLSPGKVLLALSWLFYSNESLRRNVDQRVHEEDGAVPFLSMRTISLTKCRVATLTSTPPFRLTYLPKLSSSLLSDPRTRLRGQSFDFNLKLEVFSRYIRPPNLARTSRFQQAWQTCRSKSALVFAERQKNGPRQH